MTNQTAGDAKKKRTRSPAYPFVNLEAALKRAKEFYDKEQRNAANLNVAVKHWNYVEKSSGGLQTAATLISFGLLKDEGTGAKRKLQVTQVALRILLDQRPDSAEKAALLKQVALTPKIHKQLWDRWGSAPPSEAEMRHTLLVDWEPPFNEKSVDGFIKEYKDTIAFAKLTESDRVSGAIGEEETPKGPGNAYLPKIGDYVQWEQSGLLQLPEPKKVRGLFPDGKFALVDGSNTGIPVEELIKEQAPAGTPVVPPTQEVRFQATPPGRQMQEDVFSLKEGRVVLQWPTPLSEESVQDLKDWLRIVERKLARAVPPKESGVE
ncbi:MAG: hypothetical protein ABSG77_02160 [Candidatus Acidiferrum sp.]|jgi:hypothetical protein